MTLDQVIAQFRLDRDDAVAPYLWSTAEVRGYLNEALNEVCERALLVEDSTTAACCEITLVAGQSVYPLHASVVKVKRVTYDGKKIGETSIEALDGADFAWETRTGPPTEYVLSETSVRVTPTPTVASVALTDTIALTVYRKPLAAIDEDTDTDTDLATLAGVPSIYHRRMMEWMHYLALRKNDTQTIDLDGAKIHGADFEASFGMRPDANVQRKRRDRRPPIVRAQWL